MYDEADAYADPHFEQRGVFRPVDPPGGGHARLPRPSAPAGRAWNPVLGVPAPLVGQDNEYVYKKLLGYIRAGVPSTWRTAGLIGTSYPRPAAPG